MTAVVLLSFLFFTAAVAAAVYYRIARPNDVSIGMVALEQDGDESEADGNAAGGDGQDDGSTAPEPTETSIAEEPTTSVTTTSVTVAPSSTGAPLEGVLRDGRVTLTGAVPDVAVGELFAGVIEGFVGEGNVDRAFTLDEGVTPPNSFTLSVVDNVLFEPGGDTINPRFLPVLDQIVQFMRLDPNITLVVEGHTDSTDSAVENLALSQRRAEAVGAYVSGQGIDEFRLEANGRGSSDPVANEDTPEGRDLNRRIEFELVGFRVQGS